jgi:hypothetical protein
MKLKFKLQTIPINDFDRPQSNKDNIPLLDLSTLTEVDLWFLWDKNHLENKLQGKHCLYYLKKLG